MAKKIICPKCGQVDYYWIKEYVYRNGIFNADDECVETTEDIGIKYGKPRCMVGNRLVKFKEQEDGNVDYNY